jgi:thiamine biosynthesis lipoprotein
MTTHCEVTIYNDNQKSSDEIAILIIKEVKRLEKKYNYFNPDSLLSQINNRVVNIIDKETKELLSRSKKYYSSTNKTFDITIATIKDFYKNAKAYSELEQQISKVKEYVGCEHFQLKKDKIIFDNEYTKIDFGGIVKEYSVDRTVNILRKHKIKSALVNYGGDIYALGRKPDNTLFEIGIKNPDNPKHLIRKVCIENEALTTSGSYERNYKIEDKEFSHIISKNNKIENKSVTIISSNCVESGVYSTSMIIDKNLTTKKKKIILN